MANLARFERWRARRHTRGVKAIEERVGPYRICAELASGGMGEVMLACDDRFAGVGRVVALKRLRREHKGHADFSEMFADEARIAARVRHPNVCSVLDYDASAEPPYLVMELVGGETLCNVENALRKAGDGITARRRALLVAKILVDACEGVHAAHETRGDDGRSLGLVHRDVSLDNLILSYDGVVKVIDFGVVRAEGREHRTQTGHVKGKLAYLAPELLLGCAADRRADIWGLGVVLWELLTLTRLFRQNSDLETLRSVAAAPIAAPSKVCPDLPKELDPIVLRALARDRNGRFDTARELARALSAFLAREREPIGLGDLSDLVESLFPDGRRKHERLVAKALKTMKSEPGSGRRSRSFVPRPTVDREAETREVTLSSQRTALVASYNPAPALPFSSAPPGPPPLQQAALKPPVWRRPQAAIALVAAAFAVAVTIAYAGGPPSSHASSPPFVTSPPAATPPPPPMTVPSSLPFELTTGRYVLEVVDEGGSDRRVWRIHPSNAPETQEPLVGPPAPTPE
jgi:eukaryotic-like serine/threonine-protein kinase